MARNRVKITSKFKALPGASDKAVAELIRKGTDAMDDTARQRLDKTAGRRGYNLRGSDIQKEVSDDDGKITYPHFYGRFFEYGTPNIPAMPFMRPGHRAGRKVVKNDAPDVFQKWFTRRAKV